MLQIWLLVEMHSLFENHGMKEIFKFNYLQCWIAPSFSFSSSIHCWC